MTEEERTKEIEKLNNNSLVMRRVPCKDAGFVASFDNFGKIRISIPEAVKTKVLNIICAEYQKEIEDLESKECTEEEHSGAVVYSWEEAMAKHRKELVYGK